MIKIKILSIGRTKESWLDAAIEEYLKRLKTVASIEFTWAKDNAQLVELAGKEPQAICLDPRGNLHTSEEFAKYFHSRLERGGSRLAFIIGGAEGLPISLKKNKELMSLSPMTFTHQMSRLILIEQIYRAFELQKGSQYHK